MKVHRHLLRAAWLAVCALLLLSACGGPTPIAGRVTETVTPASPTTGVSPSPAATATETPPTPPPATATPTPPATDTPAPDDAKPGRPTETPAVLNITPPEISGYLLKQGPDGGWVYKDKSGKEVAHTVIYNWKGLSSKEISPKGAIVVSDNNLMAYLLKTASVGRVNTEMLPFPFPLPFNPQGLELQEVNNKYGHTVIAINGQIQKVVQPFPGNKSVLFNKYNDSSGIWIAPYDRDPSGIIIFSSSFYSSLQPYYDYQKPFYTVLASQFSDKPLPSRYMLSKANAVITASNSNGTLSVALADLLSINGFIVTAG